LEELSSIIIPEFFVVFGINVFLVTSLLTCLLDFPVISQYIYQLAALAGFGQLWANLAISSNVETRFLFNVVYLAAALVNVVVVNAYIVVVKKQLSLAGVFLGAVTIPVFFTALFTVSSYVNKIPLSIPVLPVIPLEAINVILIICGVILATSVVTSFGLGLSLADSSLNNREREVKRWMKRRREKSVTKQSR
jgi:hypothetical protein